jgi:hypothetical protein
MFDKGINGFISSDAEDEFPNDILFIVEDKFPPDLT